MQGRCAVADAVSRLGEADVLQLGVIAQNQRGLNLVAGRNCAEDPVVGLADRERHGHAFHQAGHILVCDGQGASSGIDCYHAAL